MAKLIYSKRSYINILYVAYVLNFSVVTIFYPEINVQLIRNGLLVFLVLMLIKTTTLRLNKLIFLLLFFCFLSIVFNTINPIFNSSVRFVFLLLVMFPLGLVLKPKYSSEEFIDLKFIFNFNAVIVVVSLMLYILFDFGSFFQKGNFSGLLSHSNTMGPISGLVFLERFISYFKKKKSLKTIIICLVSFLVVVLTGSRAALFTLILALFFVAIYIFRLKFIIWGIGILLALVLSFFIFKEFNSSLITETHRTNIYRPRTIFEKGFDNTRLLIWEERIDEFIESPLLGSGFSAVNTDIVPEGSPSYDIETGSIQPGSGILGILSMTGILGLSCFVLILINAIKILLKRKNKFDGATYILLVSALIFILLHSVFEGYLLSSGNILFFLFWITISYIFNKRETNN